MSIRKMTFSLASLILILGLVFATAPAMAQSVEITADVASADVAGSSRTIDRTLTFANDSGATIPAGGYLIIHRGNLDNTQTDGSVAGLPSLGANVVTYRWDGTAADADMPDLEALFGEEGGTILLKASQTNVDAAGTDISANDVAVGLKPRLGNFPEFRYDHDGDDDDLPDLAATAGNGIKDADEDGEGTDPEVAARAKASPARDPGVDDLTITEIMWAINTANVGSGSEQNHQWIEIWNRNTAVAFPLKGIVLHLASGRPALSADPTEAVGDATTDVADLTPARIVVDRVSNVVDAGWVSDVGSNGFDDGPEGAAEEPFVSMYRKRDKLAKNDGTAKGNWVASTQVSFANHRGTPGKAERAGTKTFTRTDPTLSVVFNEVSNRTDRTDGGDNYEWIELMIREGDPNFKNWEVSLIKPGRTEETLFELPELNKSRFDKLLLITASDPAGDSDHPLAMGYNVANDDNGQQPGHDPTIRYYVADWQTTLPDDGDFVLMLRSNKDKTNHETVVDIAGKATDLAVNTASLFTNLWPLINYPAPNIALNELTKDIVHRRQKPDIAGTRTADKKDNKDHVAMRDVGWTGIGYKRNADATAANGGTPGYDNGSLKGQNNADAIAAIVISEVMAVAGERNLPGWIELQNISNPIGVNLNNWRISIINHDSDGAGGSFEGKLTYTINLTGKLPAGQNYLIVARRGRDDTNLPDERIDSFNLKRTDLLLNPYGFQIKLEAKKDDNYFHVDTVGNLSPKPEDSRRADAQSFEPIAWELPAQMNDDGDRISLVRAKDDGMPVDGTMEGALIRFDMSNQIDTILDPTSYGHATDIGSPGHHPGGVLPVSLSKFRPERLKATGEVVVRWVTESELNNAGFNILRSETRTGDFTKVHFVAGQGTTSERTLYEWKDKSAKPNVVYYYQIQDVSLDGDVTTLRTTHLRGNVTAAGKLTTTWGEIKALR